MTAEDDGPSETPSISPCPSCRSPQTIETFQHYGERFYFCVDCEHTWSLPAVAGEEGRRPARRPR